MSGEAFLWRQRVGFGDCDPAGIAYTGRIADFALTAIDAFWEHLLGGEGWYRMHREGGYGMPFVRMEYDFRSPITPLAPLLCQVVPERLGRTSVALAVTGQQDGRTSFEARSVSVFAMLATLEKIEVPAHIRAALLARHPGLSAPA